MKSILSSRVTTAPSTSVVNYIQLTGNRTGSATESAIQEVISSAGVITNFLVKLDSAPGAAKQYVFTLRVNGVDSALTCTISGAASTTGTDTSHSVNVSAGDLVSISCTPSGTPTSSLLSLSLQFTGNTANESLFLGSSSTLSTSATEYQAPQGRLSGNSTTIETHLTAVSGNIKNLYVKLTVAPGGATSRTFTLYVNGVSTSLTCTVTGAATTANDTTHSVAVTAGDTITLVSTLSGSPAAAILMHGMTLVATTDGQFNIATYYSSSSSSAVNYGAFYNGGISGVNATESAVQETSQSITLQALYTKVTTSPGVGKSWTLMLRVNSANTTLTCAISDTNTTANDTSHSVTTSDFDLLDWAITPAGTPSANNGIRISMRAIVPSNTSAIKTFLGLAYASTKTVDDLALASVKTWEGLA